MEIEKEGRTVSQVARRFGCKRSTIYRWRSRYHQLRQEYEIGSGSRHIPTMSSRPKTSPNSLPEAVVKAIVSIRKELNRCAEVVWVEANNRGIKVSLSSVRRIIKRNSLERTVSKWKRYRKFSKRPRADHPGALVEVDTVHFYHPITKERKYGTSVIDVYTRMAHVYLHDKILPRESVAAVLEAKKLFPFKIETIQSDNGGEFGKKFRDEIMRHGMKYRHTRVRRPNDNAHVERFNRTLREECLGDYISVLETPEQTKTRLNAWLGYYNCDRIHLGIELMTPLQKRRKGLELN